MSIWTSRPALRWLVPGLAAVLVVGGGAAASAITASGDPDLPPRSAAELLVDLQTAEVGAVSGTVVQTADLGLPALPSQDEEGSADLSSLLSGSHTLRVWYDGPQRVRVALLGTLSQTDVIRNGQDVWIWESDDNTATHQVLPEGFATGMGGAQSLHRGMTPQEVAEAALAAIEPSTEVSAEDTTRVAGRDAYELVLAPRDEASLVREVRLAIDAEQSIPLQVQVYGGGADPALEVRFTQISFDPPDAEQFEFNPPPEATVTEGLGELPWSTLPHGAGERPEFAVVGDGWTSVLVARIPAGAEPEGADRMLPFLELLPEVSGDWGTGHVIESELLSALLTDDGRVLVGAVTGERLAQVAGDPAAALED